jgi:DNA-binding transcriptional MerR regulator
LSEVGERTGISMPSLLRYKKEHQGRIPAVGKGRTQRYPVEALPVFEAIKRENLSKRGRPKGSGGRAAKAGRPAGGARRAASGGGRRGGRSAAGAAAAGGELLTLTEVGEKTGISYPTLRNYVERHGDRIPSVGEGRRRRFPPEAVPVFRELRAESRPGRKPAGGAAARKAERPGGARRAAGGGAGAAATDGVGSAELARRVAELAKRQERLQRDLERAHELLTRPAQATLSWR